MALYARLDRAAVNSLAGRFGIDDVTSFSVMEGGNENTNYCLETISTKYVLTLCDQKSLEQATNLANLLVYLNDHGIRTSGVVVPLNEPIVLMHDKKPVMMKRHILGEVTTSLSDSLLVQLGVEIARLHSITAPSYLPKSFPYGRRYFSEITDSEFDHPFVAWLSAKNQYLQEQIPQNLPKTLVHGDVFSDNVIIEGDQLKAIIDFEEACHYYRNFDLGMVIVGTCRNQQRISFQKAKQFLRGYQNVISLEPTERRCLKAFTVYAAVATSFWRFRQYHLRRPEPQLHRKHVEMQSLADTISEYPESSFAELFD
jgi:homoserine kinase type II